MDVTLQMETGMDQYQLTKAAYAEGFDDGVRGDNYNPFDFDYKPEEWQAYENGYLQGVMSGSYDGE